MNSSLDFGVGLTRALTGRRRVLCALVAIVVTCVLWGRPFSWMMRRGDPDARDFAPIIAGAHCLFRSCDPYDSNAAKRFFFDLTGGDVFMRPETPVYPPSTFLVVSPLLLLKWRPMYLTWALLSAGALLAAYILLILKFELFTSLVAYLPIVISIQSGIIFPALWVGQPAVLAIASGAIAVISLVSGTAPVLSTLLLALSLSLKPQLVLLPAIYLLFRKTTRIKSIAALILATLAFVIGASLLHSQLGSFSFFARESANVKLALEHGHLSDPSSANRDSPDFLNLAMPLSRLDLSLPAANRISFLGTFALFAGLAYAYLHEKTARSRPYTIIAVLILISLLAAYHRGYDRLLILLIIPALWELRSRSRALYWTLTATMFLWIFNHRILENLSARAARFQITAFLELAMCLLFLASLMNWSGQNRPESG